MQPPADATGKAAKPLFTGSNPVVASRLETSTDPLGDQRVFVWSGVAERPRSAASPLDSFAGANASPWSRCLRAERRPVPRPGSGRGRGPDDAVRRAHDHEPQARGRDDPRPRPAAPQRVRPGDGRGRRVRGADRVARRPGRVSDAAVHPASEGMGARRGRAARAPAIYRNIRTWLQSIGIELGRSVADLPAAEPVVATPAVVEAG